MLACQTHNAWSQFLQYAKKHSSKTAFDNWLATIQVVESSDEELTLEVPNIFVKEYLLSNYKEDLCAFLPVNAEGEPSIIFIIKAPIRRTKPSVAVPNLTENSAVSSDQKFLVKLNPNYRFDNFIEGPANQFVKSAAIGVGVKPGLSYNPLFIHGPVGLGKTHLLHSIGNYIVKHHPKLRVQCITTEEFINNLVDSLKKKTIDKMKRFYRSDIDVLLVDDIQFLQNRINFEEELCHTFEILRNQNKQIVITSDKPPSQLKLSERIIARMEWGLVAHIGVPELETRVAILLHKAQQKGLEIPSEVAFYIAEHIYHNVRQLEGAVNRLSLQSRLLDLNITEELVEKTLGEMIQHSPNRQVSVDEILKVVATVFQVRVSDLRGNGRTKNIALARQVAMFLANKLIKSTKETLSDSFGKTHSTFIHACNNIVKKQDSDETLSRHIEMCSRSLQN